VRGRSYTGELSLPVLHIFSTFMHFGPSHCVCQVPIQGGQPDPPTAINGPLQLPVLIGLCSAVLAEPVGKKKKTASHSNDAAPVLTKREPIGLFSFTISLPVQFAKCFLSVDSRTSASYCYCVLNLAWL